MTDRHRQRIGDVVRRRGVVEAEQQLHHLLDLRLLGAAVADHRALDFGRRVLDDRQARLRRRQQRDAARVPQLERAADVARVEDDLDRDAVRLALGEQRDQAGVNVLQSFGKSSGGGRGERAAEDKVVAAAGSLHAAVTRTFGAGIDPEDFHANDASISFSSMSAFDHTFFVSSCSSTASISLTICCAGLPSSLT